MLERALAAEIDEFLGRSRYQRRLLNFVYRTIGDRERGEDLVQEVFIRVHRHLHRFDQTKKFSTWIYTIASNLAKNEQNGFQNINDGRVVPGILYPRELAEGHHREISEYGDWRVYWAARQAELAGED